MTEISSDGNSTETKMEKGGQNSLLCHIKRKKKRNLWSMNSHKGMEMICKEWLKEVAKEYLEQD